MLLHAAIPRSDKDCPLYNRGNILPIVDALKKRDDLAQKHSITLYWMVSGAPEHVSYALFESDHIDKVTQFLHEVFITPSAFKITPVQMMNYVILSGVNKCGRCSAGSTDSASNDDRANGQPSP